MTCAQTLSHWWPTRQVDSALRIPFCVDDDTQGGRVTRGVQNLQFLGGSGGHKGSRLFYRSIQWVFPCYVCLVSGGGKNKVVIKVGAPVWKTHVALIIHVDSSFHLRSSHWRSRKTVGNHIQTLCQMLFKWMKPKHSFWSWRVTWIKLHHRHLSRYPIKSSNWWTNCARKHFRG